MSNSFTSFVFSFTEIVIPEPTPTPVLVSSTSATEQPTVTPTATPTPIQIPEIARNNALRVTLPQYTAENVRPIMNTTIVNLMKL